jgi:ribonuclease HII
MYLERFGSIITSELFILTMIYGCDEAGKGPVIGSMFIACVKGELEEIPSSVDDSKNLTTSKIHSLAKKIKSNFDYSVIEVKPDEIDSRSMTEVSTDKFCESINKVSYRSCTDGYIDCFINNKQTVEENIRSTIDIPEDQELHVEFSADEKFEIVSAASILAKSAREKHIEEISKEYGEVGSGYPSDPNTREFLRNYAKKNGGFPEFVRFSWSTIDDIREEVID